MNNAPKVKPGDWIVIGTVDCLVIELHADKPTPSDIDVSCNPERPAVVETVVCLVPVRTDSAWFQDTLSPDADIYLLQGRVRFLNSQVKPSTRRFH